MLRPYRALLAVDSNPLLTETGCEVGAAWNKTARKTGKAYISARLDSPFLSKPLNLALFQAKGRGQAPARVGPPEAQGGLSATQSSGPPSGGPFTSSPGGAEA
jgi:hypothetical protein